MKEHIYTIALTDSLTESCSCAMCTLEKKLEQEAVNYFLGPSLMEPDSRMITNEKGFCRRHMYMLFDQNNRLGLGLTLETHLTELIKSFRPSKKSGLFSSSYDVTESGKKLFSLSQSCTLCDKLNEQMRHAARNFAFLISTEDEFKSKFTQTDGLCLEHMALVVSQSEKELSGKKFTEFIDFLYDIQIQKFTELQKDVHSFTLSFDYRNTEAPSQKVTASVQAAVDRLSKYR